MAPCAGPPALCPLLCIHARWMGVTLDCSAFQADLLVPSSAVIHLFPEVIPISRTCQLVFCSPPPTQGRGRLQLVLL